MDKITKDAVNAIDKSNGKGPSQNVNVLHSATA